MAITAEQINILISATNTASGQFAAVSRDAATMGANLTRVGRTLTRTVSLPLAAIGVAATKMAVTFDEEMTKVITLVGVADAQVNQWREDILALGPAIGRGPTELARALFVVTSAGERGANALEVVRQAGMAAAIGLGDTATTARAVTAAMQAYKDAGLSASRATEILVATVREGNLVAEDLAGSLGRVLGTAAQLGVEFDEVGGFIATFTRLGVSAEEATTALRQILASILKPVKDTEDALATAGLSAAMLRDQLGREGLVSVLELLMDSFGGNIEMLAKVIPNIRALSGVLGTAGVQSAAFAEINRNIANSLGIVEEGFSRVQDTPAQQWRAFTAEAQAMFIELGANLIPTFLKLMDTIRGVIDGWSRLSDGAQGVIIKLAGIAVLLGPMVLTVGLVSKAYLGLAAAFKVAADGAILFAAATAPEKLAILGTVAGLALITAELVAIGKAALDAERDMEAMFDAQAGALESGSRLADLWNAKIQNLRETNRELFDDFSLRRQEFVAQGMDSIRAVSKAWHDMGIEAQTAATAVADVNVSEPLTAADEAARKFSATIQEMGAEMKRNYELAQEHSRLFGDSFDLTAANASIARSAIEAFVAEGADMNTVIGEGGYRLGQLVDWYRYLDQAIRDAQEQQEEFNSTFSRTQAILGAIETPLQEYSRLLNEAKALRIQMPFVFSEEDFNTYVALIKGNYDRAMKALEGRAALSGEEIGQSIVSGMVRGVSDGDLWDTMERVLMSLLERGIIAIITGGLGIASPSKVAIGWGQSVVDGLAGGLSETAKVRAAVDAMINEVSGITIDVTMIFCALSSRI